MTAAPSGMDATLVARLEAMPVLLARVVSELPPDRLGQRGRGPFSVVEHVWHLADLEREGYGVRIQRLLTENEPHLSDFSGGRIARERDYQESDSGLGLTLFAHARRRNLTRLAGLDAQTLTRAGIQEGVGRMTLADVAGMMAEHDRGHAEELAELLEEIAADLPVLAALRARAADIERSAHLATA